MAPKNPVGTMFVELDMDTTKYTKAQKEILKAAHETSLDIETNFKRLGGTSDAMFQAMRQKAENAYAGITHSAKSSSDEIRRAKEALNAKMKSLDEQQYGAHVSMIDKMKQNWIGLTAGVAAAWVTAGKALEYAQLGAKAQQAEESFRIVARNIGADADRLLSDLKRAAAGTMDESDMMQKAVSGMVKGLNADQLVGVMTTARISARAAGTDVKTAYEEITDAIANQMPRSLKRYGLVTKEEMALVSKALAAGVEDVNLYRIAMMNAEIQAARMGAVHSNAAERLQAFNATIQEAKENVGKFAIELGQRLMGAFYGFAGALTKIAAPLAYLIGGQEAYNAMNESGNDLMRTAAKLAGVVTDEERKAAAASQEGAAARIKAAEAAKKVETDRIKAQVEQAEQAKKTKAERERMEKEIADTVLKNAETIKAIGLSQYEQDVAQTNAKVALYQKAGVAQVLVAQFVASQTEVAAKKAKDAWDEVFTKLGKPELVGLEKTLEDIAKKYDEIRKKFKGSPSFDEGGLSEKQAAEEGAATWEWNTKTTEAIRKNDEELLNRRKENEEEYKKIVTESNDWSISEHQRAINKILSDEKKNVARMYELWEAGAISIAELTAGLAAVRGASAEAIGIQNQKTLADMANFYSQITGYEEQYRNKQLEWIDAEAKRRAEAYKDDVAAAKWAAQEKGKLEQNLFEKKSGQVHQSLGEMASAFQAISSMYEENSDEYARMQDAAKAMIVLQQAVAVANAVAAIANQGLGDPYTAFARIAAMAAAMGSLLASAGMSFGGGGVSAPILPASTVLGAEAGTGSESISKSWEKMMDLDTLQYRELRGIHDSMKELNQNITALVASIVRTGTIGGTMGMSTGYTMGGAESQYWKTPGVTAGISPTSDFMKKIDPIDALVNMGIQALTGWAADKIFGGGISRSLQSAGIEFKGMTAGQLIAGEYVDAMQYAVVKSVKDGGWFHSDSTFYQTIYADLDAGVNRLFEQVMVNMGESLKFMAEGLGTDVNAALSYVFNGEQLDLKGLTGEELEKKINEYFSGMADKAAETLFGGIIAQYQQLDEGLFETAMRLVVDKEIILETLSMTGQAFTGTVPQIIAFSEAIIDLAGGLDKVQEAASTYYDKFFSDAEKQARLQTQLSGALEDIGMVLPGGRGGYRALVEGLNLTTEAGKIAYVTLLQLSEAADRYYSALEDVGGAQEDLTEALREQVTMIREWVADMNRSSLAPVTSRKIWEDEYARQKALAYAPGATTQDVAGFLNYAKDYLAFQKRFTGGTNYQGAYDAVIKDVEMLGDVKDAALTEIEAIAAADAAARAAAAAQLAALNTISSQLAGNPPGTVPTYGGGYYYPPATETTQPPAQTVPPGAVPTYGGGYYYPPATEATPIQSIEEVYPGFGDGGMAEGGLMIGPTIGGEAGPEWAVPTYEPQRSRFLRDVGVDTEAIGRSIARHIGSSKGGGGDRTINVNLIIDRKPIASAIVQSLRDGDQELVKQIRKVAN